MLIFSNSTFPAPFTLALVMLVGCSDDPGGRPDAGTAATLGAGTSESNSTSTTATGDGPGTGDGDGDPMGDGDGDPMGTPTEAELRVAFIGDQGLSSDATAVLDLVVAEGAEFLVIAGDFDYTDDPTAWDEQNVAALGPDFPVFGAAGNHDEAAFYGAEGYQAKLMERLQPALDDGAVCTGEIGLNSTCTYKGLFMAFSGVDVYNDQAESTDYLANVLAGNDAIWSVCVWHKNQNDMQAGGKDDEAGWGVYQSCQDQAGIIITGHEHSYSRTFTLTGLGNAAIGHGATGQPDLMLVGEGSTYVSVVGTGGQDLRDYEAPSHADDTWWATIYTTNYYLRDGEVMSDWNPVPGALFIDFHVDGDPYKARAFFKNIDGEILDEYEIVRDPVMTGDGDSDPTSGDGDADPTTGGDPADLTIVDFDDAYVDGSAQASNFGNANDLLIDSDPDIYETFLRPNLAAIPPNTPIATATLRIFAHDSGDDAQVHVVGADWSEDTITYENRPNSGAAVASFATNTGWIEVDVTATVQAWIDGGTNYGFHLRSEGGNGSDYYSSESANNGPELLIWY